MAFATLAAVRRSLHALRYRGTRIIAVASIVGVALLALTAGTASAYVPTYYDEPAYSSDLQSYVVAAGAAYVGAAGDLSMNSGGAYAGASQAPSIRAGTWLARAVAKSLPRIA